MSSTHKVPYYFNVNTNSSTWDPPLPKDEIRKLPGAHYLEQPTQIRASHLLIKHKESRRPSSWKEVRDISPIVDAMFLPTRVSTDHDYAVQGRSDCHFAKAPSRDQRCLEQVGQVWRTRQSAFRLFIAREERRSGLVCARSDAKAV